MTDSTSASKATRKGGTDHPQPPAKGPVKPRMGKDFGEEGTNKTQAAPKPDGAQPEELGISPHIEKSPYTRG